MRSFTFLLVIVALGCAKKADDNKSEVTVVDSEIVISETISAEEFQRRLSEDSNGVLLDVRTPEEVAGGQIEGATNIDFRAPDFAEKVGQLDKTKTYYLYCAGGGRSRRAADAMKSLEFKKVYDLDGGFNGWSGKGLPVSH